MLPKKHISYTLSDSRKSSEDEGKQKIAQWSEITTCCKWCQKNFLHQEVASLEGASVTVLSRPQGDIEEMSPNFSAEGWELGW